VSEFQTRVGEAARQVAYSYRRRNAIVTDPTKSAIYDALDEAFSDFAGWIDALEGRE
jgi:hypothetical protein